jgi:hypothetical protein
MGRWNYHLMGSDYAQDELGELAKEIFLEYFEDEDLEDMWEILGTEEAKDIFQNDIIYIVENYYSFALPFFLMDMNVRVPADLYPMLINMTKDSNEYKYTDIDKTYEEYLKYFISNEFTDEQLLEIIEKGDKEFNDNLFKTLGSGLFETLEASEDGTINVLLEDEEDFVDYYDDDDFEDNDLEDDDFEDDDFEDELEDDDNEINLFNWQERTNYKE